MEVEVKPIKQPHHAAALRAAFPATIPVLTGYLCIGMAYGLLMANAGYGVFWALLLSLLCYAGSMEFVAVSLLEKYRGTGWARPFLIFSLTDETFSLVSTLEPPDGVTRRDFYFWISLLDYLYWQMGSVLGALIGGLLPFDTTGLDFALTALFIVLFLEQWRKRENRPAALIGLGCTAVSLAVVGADRLVIPAMVLILAVLLGGRNKLCD